jgi:hypothetical protein
MAEPLWNGEWMLIHSTPNTRTYIRDLGDGTSEIKKITEIDPILESAAADRSDNAGKRWGDGQIIGTVPDTIFYSSGYAEAKNNHDTAWIKRFWNDGSHKKLRTFEGQV